MKRNYLRLCRRWAFTLVLGLMAGVTYAQTAAQYVFSTATTTYTNTSGGSNMSILGDDIMDATAYNIGFTFTFAGTPYTQFRVNSNGWLTFGVGTTTSDMRINTAATNMGAFTPALMPLYDDLEAGTGSATYVTTGTAPNRVLTVEWRNWEWYYTVSGPSISFQIKLYETTNVIEFIYRQEGTALNGSESATIGIATSSTDYLLLNNATTSPTASSTTYTGTINAKPATGQVYRFTPPVTCSGQPLAGQATAAVTTFTCSGYPALNLTGGSTPTTNLTFTWESSPNGTSGWAPVTGGSNLSLPAFSPSTAITQTTYYRVVSTCSNGGGTNTSAPVTVTVNPITGPTVTNTPQTILCGTTATLSANAVPYGTVQWFTTSTNGTAFATGLTTTVSPTANTNYYAEKSFPMASGIGTTAGAIVDHNSITGDDRTGIAVSTNYVYYTGDNNTGRYDKSNLTGGTSFPLRDGFFGDLATGTLWQLSSSTTLGGTFNGGTVDRLYQLTEALVVTGSPLMLSQSISLPSNNSQTFILAGRGYVIVANPSGQYYHIDLTTGTVTLITTSTATTSYGNEGWATYGWAEFDGGNYYMVYRPSGNNIVRKQINSGTVTTVQALTNLADLSAIVFDPSNSRMYFHHEGSTQYGGSGEMLGYTTVTTTNSACANNVRSTAVVNVTPLSAAVAVTSSPICDGQSSSVTFTGTPGATITYNVNGGASQTVVLDGAGTATVNTTPTATEVYNLVSVTNNTCNQSATGSATVTVNPRPAGVISGNPIICPGGLAVIGVAFSAGSLPITINYTDGINNYSQNATNGVENFQAPATAPGVYNYTITGLTDNNGCSALPGDFSGTATVTINPNPSVTVTETDAVICDGDNTDITLTFSGTAPFDFTYNNGVMDSTENNFGSNTYTFNVSPVTATNYYVLSITDNNGCSAQATDLLDSATVTMHQTVAITTQPTDAPSACTGTGSSFTVAATGDGLNYQWYNGTTALTNGGIYSGVDMATFNISDVTGLSGTQYHAVITDTCGNMVNSDTVTVTEDFSNSWTGVVNQDWNNAGNWSCGTLPTLTTNVTIPATAPNMPWVNITNAQANNITIDAGASLMFVGTANELQVAGNITDNGIFDASSGTVVLLGTGAQNIPAVTYGNLDIMGGSVKTLDGDATVTGVLTLSSGHIVLDSNDLMLSSPWNQAGGSASSFIVTNDSGNVVGQGMGVGGNPDPVTFHVGTAVGSYNPIRLENLGTVDTFMVRIVDSVFVDGYGVSPITVDNPVVNKTWMVSETTPGGSIVNMTPFWNHPGDEINGFDTSHVYVAHYMGGMWTSDLDSALEAPGAIIAGNMLAAFEDSITSLSPFTVASSGPFPLNIKLIDVSAANAGSRNKVDWKSATEATGDSYVVETSADGRSFTQLATVPANGKPSAYTYWHQTPVTGVNYYRIKTVDADNKIGYSKVVSATVKATGIFAVEAFPNPVTSNVTVMVKGTVTGTGYVTVNDVTGKVIKSAVKVENNKAEINLGDVANGMYFINYTDDANQQSIKINKQ